MTAEFSASLQCSCGHKFAACDETFYAAQVIPDIQYCLLYTCPHCRSTRSILMWESYEVAAHFGETDEVLRSSDVEESRAA